MSKFCTKLKRTNKVVLQQILDSSGLKKRHYEVLYSFYIEEMSTYEIAEKLGLTYESISFLGREARKALTECFLKSLFIYPETIQEYIKNHFLDK